MESVAITAEQLQTVAEWAMPGEDFTRVTVSSIHPPHLDGWREGDIVATQGDALLHVDRSGAARSAIP